LRMPFVSGVELIEQLHSEPRTSAIPIVVVSGDSDAAWTLHASGLVHAVVRKPFDVYALVDCIGSVAASPTKTTLVSVGSTSTAS